MDIKSQLEKDLKTAMLAGENDKVTTLRGLKSALQYVEVAEGLREQGLSQQQALDVLAKEAKKRQEAADIYVKGGDQTRAQAELAEKAIIQQYLPVQLSDLELAQLVDQAITSSGATDAKAMGQIIGVVKAKAGSQADGSRIAKMVREKLQ
jgi:uncharacterized protein YqeY